MSSEFWNEKYSVSGFRYGTAPNAFVAEHARDYFEAGERVLCLGAGEGRNAVWLAEQGYGVTAVEQSSAGIDKMLALAAEREVSVDVIHADVGEFEPEEGGYAGVVLSYLHVGPELRPVLHAKACAALAPGGAVVLEAFRPEQLERDSGGPPDESMLYTEELLREDFGELELALAESTTIELDEGQGHRGRGEVVRIIAVKPGES